MRTRTTRTCLAPADKHKHSPKMLPSRATTCRSINTVGAVGAMISNGPGSHRLTAGLRTRSTNSLPNFIEFQSTIAD